MFQSLIRGIANDTADNLMGRMLKDEYTENIFVLITAAQKLTVRAIIEACMRGESGEVLSRSLGSPNVQSPWNKLYLNPTQLFSLPTKDEFAVDTQVTIGKNAVKPLKLSMPIMITGMSYGASLSLNAKVALAKGASLAGISTNTGEAPVTNEERKAATLLIGQYNRYRSLCTVEQLSQLDAIEVQLGQGAWGGAMIGSIKPENIGDHMRESWHLGENQPANRGSRFEEANTPKEIIDLVNKLKKDYEVPVGIKIAASHFIEKELDIVMQTNADFITIDGAEGGTAGSPPTLQDDMGLPTLYAVSRAAKYLEQNGVKDKYDIILAGGLSTPGHFLKALALGASAVYIGSIALIAMIQAQAVKATPNEPTPQLVLYDGKLTDELDVELGAKTLSNFLNSCNEEMKLALVAMGKTGFDQLSTTDLVTVDKDLSDCLGIGYAGYPSNQV